MKILNCDNYKTSLYIQKEDLIIIKQKYKVVPDFVDIALNDTVSNDDFVVFNDKSQIGFINLFKWIIDYKKYQFINIDDYKKMYQEYIRNMQQLNQEILFNSEDDLAEIDIKKSIISKQFKDIYAIFQNRFNGNKIKLPIISDDSKDCYQTNEYTIKPCLYINMIIVERNDLKKIEENELNGYIIGMFNEIMKKTNKSFNKDTFSEYELSFNEEHNQAIIEFKKLSNKEIIKTKQL